MDDKQPQDFFELFALVDTGLEVQRSEIDEVRRHIRDMIASIKAESNQHMRSNAMSALKFYVMGAMDSRVKAMRETQATVERILDGWKKGS